MSHMRVRLPGDTTPSSVEVLAKIMYRDGQTYTRVYKVDYRWGPLVISVDADESVHIQHGYQRAEDRPA